MIAFITLSGLANFIVLSVVALVINLAVWIRIIFLYKEKGLLLCVTWCAVVSLTISVWKIKSGINDKAIKLFVIVFTVLSIGNLFLDPSLIPFSSLLIVLAAVAGLLLLVFFAEQNSQAYFLLRSKRTNIDIFKWANSQNKTINWNKIFESNNTKQFITNALSLYFRMCGWRDPNNHVPENSTFRSAVFKAWSTHNKTSPGVTIGFTFIDGIVSADVFVLSTACENKKFLSWWVLETISHPVHEQSLIKFLSLVKERTAYNYEDYEQKQRVTESLKAVISVAENSAISYELLTALKDTLHAASQNKVGYEGINMQ